VKKENRFIGCRVSFSCLAPPFHCLAFDEQWWLRKDTSRCEVQWRMYQLVLSLRDSISLCSPGYIENLRSSCFRLLSTGITCVCHCAVTNSVCVCQACTLSFVVLPCQGSLETALSKYLNLALSPFLPRLGFFHFVLPICLFAGTSPFSLLTEFQIPAQL
jgi:hypothetical protein